MTSFETGRKNWQMVKTYVKDYECENIWDDFELKQNIKTTDGIYKQIKEFIKTIYKLPDTLINSTNSILTFNIEKSNRRAEIHTLCDLIGLQHESKTIDKKRILHIYFPKDWKWEYSASNKLAPCRNNYNYRYSSRYYDEYESDDY